MNDEFYMRRAIELAKNGIGKTNPNPLVGAVIVKDNKIIGEGFHERCGSLHAERNAFASLKESAEGAVLYVTLEPCCHYGRTPPCTEAIIEHKIAKVIIGSRDPNPLVSGKGAKILREHHISVQEDFLKEECDALNDIFFHYIQKKTPYIIMKYAMTADGKIATVKGESKWITNETSRNEVQKLRNRLFGIMIGIGTVQKDDPLLNCRLENGRSPVRIICDSKLSIDLNSNICRTAELYKTYIACAYPEFSSGFLKEENEKIKALSQKGISVINCPKLNGENGVHLSELMKILGKEGIDSILLEGGGTLNQAALSENIVNEVLVFIAPKIFGGNALSPVSGTGVNFPDEAVKLNLINSQLLDGDILLKYKIEKR